MMTLDFRDKWVELLRSGTIQQGIGYLCNDDKRCCLGVAYLADDAGATITSDRGTTYFSGKPGMPAQEHLESWGLTFNGAQYMAELNDEGKTFDEIADHIMTLPVAD